MAEKQKVYCKPCDRFYASRQSFYKHKKRFHSENDENTTKLPQNHQNDDKNTTKLPQKSSVLHKKTTSFLCEQCNKYFSRKDSLNRHLKKCDGDKPKYEELENMYTKLKSDLLDLMNKKYKIHHKTLKKLCKENNIEIDNSITNNITQTNSNNQINSNNTTINIIALGGEDIPYVLSKKEQLKILNSGYMSLNKLIEYVHFNDDYPQFQNIAITNLNNPYAYQYDEHKNKYIACKKEELIRDVIEFRMIDIDDFYKKYGNKLNDKMKKVVQDLIDKMDDDNVNKLQLEKSEQVKIMIYNNSNTNLTE